MDPGFTQQVDSVVVSAAVVVIEVECVGFPQVAANHVDHLCLVHLFLFPCE